MSDSNLKIVPSGVCGRERAWPRPDAAFSVAELMLAVAIMGVIIFALYSVFNQTQRALRSTEAQGNVADRARAVADIISREIEQARPTFSSVPVLGTSVKETNLFGGIESAAFRPTIQSNKTTEGHAE